MALNAEELNRQTEATLKECDEKLSILKGLVPTEEYERYRETCENIKKQFAKYR